MRIRKIVLLVTMLISVCSSIVVFGAFFFDKTINGTAEAGKIAVTDRNFLEYGSYTAVTTGSYSSTTTYYKYNSTANLYTEATITSENFVTDGTLYTYNDAATNYHTISANSGESLNCYATVRSGNSDEYTNYPYLNRVGLKFKFKSSIDVYLRIEFKDAWKSHKTYVTTSTIDERYITKDKIEGDSPFSYSTDSNWIFDETNDCAYYKYVIPATCDDISATDATTSSDYIFRVNPEYWYTTTANVSYREMIIIELTYNVSIVQANRAEKKWDVDFDDLGIQRTYSE